MIYINHIKKAIYIHIPKTGGSYISDALVKYYGFINYLPLLMKKRPDHDIVCKTFSYKKIYTGNALYDNSFFNKFIGLICYCITSDYLLYQMNMNKEKWIEYTKFCFIRNPYERVLSGWKHFNIIFNYNIDFYTYINNPKTPISISDIEYEHIFMSQKVFIQNENGDCGVDIIGRFEHLEDDFILILKQLGFNIIHKQKKINVSNKIQAENIVLDIQSVQRINELFKDDFDYFHYKKIPI